MNIIGTGLMILNYKKKLKEYFYKGLPRDFLIYVLYCEYMKGNIDFLKVDRLIAYINNFSFSELIDNN